MARRLRAQADPHMRFTWRLHVSMIVFIGLLGLVVYRLARVQIVQRGLLQEKYEKLIYRQVKIGPNRGDILDRQGEKLATSAFLDSIYLDRRCFGEQAFEITQRVARSLGMTRTALAAQLTDNRIPVARKINPQLAEAVLNDVSQLRPKPKYGAVTVDSESKRLYPMGQLAATIVGFCRFDIHENRGLEGLEAQYDDILAGKTREQRLMVNNWGRSIEPIDEEILLETHGLSIQLTLDSAIQHFAESALARRVEELQARSGACVVLDPRDGSILAMASYPTYTPGEPSTRQPERMRNRVLLDAIEPGSVMKIFTYAAALEFQKIELGEIIDCEGGAYRFVQGRSHRDIKDFHSMGVSTIEEAFFQSSNIAAVKIGLRIEAEQLQRKLGQLGFGRSTGLGFPGEEDGRLPTGRDWNFYTHTSVPFGYEVKVNAVQMASAIAAIANGGARMAPRLVEKTLSARGKTAEEFKAEVLDRGIFQTRVCQLMTALMEGVVREGTGTAAAVSGYRVAGKTGTTIRFDAEAGRYSEDEYIASFGGFLPASNPRLVIYCWIDGVKRGGDAAYTGGRVTGPVFREVAEESVRILGIPPDLDGEAAIAASDDLENEAASAPETPSIEASPLKQTANRMPDLRGMTMREVREALLAIQELSPELELRPRFNGSGVVIWQNPAPDSRLSPRQDCEIHFGRPFGESPPEAEAGEADESAR